MSFVRPLALAAAILLVAGAAPAQTGAAPPPATGFVLTLSEPDVVAAGITKLTADEQDALNMYVAREVALARAGSVRGFAGTFIGRRTPEERAKAGLDRLTPGEQGHLNALVSFALAAGPAAVQPASSLAQDALTAANRLQVHGEVSLTVGGASGGRSFYGTSLYTTITDPETNLTIGLGYSQFQGNGFFGCDPGDYGYADTAFRGRGFGSGGCFRRH